MKNKKSLFCVFGLSVVGTGLVLTVASAAINSVTHADENPNKITFSKSNLFTGDDYSSEAAASQAVKTSNGNSTNFVYCGMKTGVGDNYIMDMAGESDTYPESYFYNASYQQLGAIRGMKQFSMTFDVESTIESPKVSVGVYYAKNEQSYEAWPDKLCKEFEYSSSTCTITWDFDGYKPNFIMIQNECSFDLHIRSMEIVISSDCELSKPVLTTLKTEGGTVNVSEKEEHAFQDEVKLIATPEANYKFIKWIRMNDNGSDGTTLSTEATYTHSMAKEDESIKAVFSKQYTITYKETSKPNNPYTYTAFDEFNLEPALDDTEGTCKFAGWQDADGNFVSKIGPGTTGDIVLTALWSSYSYTVTLNNTDGDIKSFYFDSTAGYSLLPDGYKKDCHFYYWKDENGNRVDSIAKGTNHDVTLTAVYIEDSVEWQKSHGWIPVGDTTSVSSVKYVTYGFYPMSQVCKPDDTSDLAIALEHTGTSETIGRFTQVRYYKGEFYYCEMTARNGEALQFRNGQTVGSDGGFNYYKFEPIKWYVFDRSSDYIDMRIEQSVFATKFNSAKKSISGESDACTYFTSTIKNKLNQDFFESAFDEDLCKYNKYIHVVKRVQAQEDFRFWIPHSDEFNSYPEEIKVDGKPMVKSTDFCFATSDIELSEHGYYSPYWLRNFKEDYTGSIETFGEFKWNTGANNTSNQEIETRHLGAVPVLRITYPIPTTK